MGVERANVDAAESEGRTALFEGEPRTVHLSLSAEQRVPPHDHPERRILFHVLDGEIALDLDEETYDLSAGDALRFDGDRQISPEAVTDARALVVLAKG
ncbi:cupin domain-containing protein [Haloarcula nitratireducens]|uniref:Cupin domain-containing protein n=1 Tax=Haloarcula nitratireducens TaxID=2487749 RepID=A0AAW4PG94_9EURY|nr:cupin domain-containing protein [Halomicroarcula nitratireducens]MBX0296485.1 cupin domain-containing protein [Halomicroarcula nitratireducens]